MIAHECYLRRKVERRESRNEIKRLTSVRAGNSSAQVSGGVLQIAAVMGCTALFIIRREGVETYYQVIVSE